jgi:hypothetical protein
MTKYPPDTDTSSPIADFPASPVALREQGDESGHPVIPAPTEWLAFLDAIKVKWQQD